MWQGMATLLEDTVRTDVDWQRLALIPDLLKAWPEALTKTHAIVVSFQVTFRLHSWT